jgi:hypothetical protein
MKSGFAAALFGLSLAALPACAQTMGGDPPRSAVAAPEVALPQPKLIVAISVDQFSADLFAQYRQHFTGGLRRLSNGVVFPSGYQGHAATDLSGSFNDPDWLAARPHGDHRQ